jgi:hypothetical protein
MFLNTLNFFETRHIITEFILLQYQIDTLKNYRYEKLIALGKEFRILTKNLQIHYC